MSATQVARVVESPNDTEHSPVDRFAGVLDAAAAFHGDAQVVPADGGGSRRRWWPGGTRAAGASRWPHRTATSPDRPGPGVRAAPQFLLDDLRRDVRRALRHGGDLGLSPIGRLAAAIVMAAVRLVDLVDIVQALRGRPVPVC